MPEESQLDELQSHLAIVHGHFREADVNLYAVVRDEMFFIPAFLRHYRELGVEQFVILDDGSIDGTKEFLSRQDDCVVLRSPLAFGDPVAVRYPDGSRVKKRWGQIVKSVIPRKFFDGKYAIYVDADEFLLMPRSVSLDDVFRMLDTSTSSNVAACMLDFFPADVGGLTGEVVPESFDDLVSLYPYFDAQALLSIEPGEWPKGVSETPTGRLLRTYGVDGEVRKRGWKRFLKRTKPAAPATMPAARKTPIAKWGKDAWLPNSHDMNTPPKPDVLLTLAHFKYTHSLRDKVRNALKWRSYSRGSGQYAIYGELLNALERSDGSMLGPKSEKFEGAEQLERLGLIHWPRSRDQRR